jgi:hypothetical protein
MRPIDADDAQRIFEQLGPVEAAKAGRDFIYTIDKVSGGTVTGQVVERAESHLALLVEEAPSNRSENVRWDDIARITNRPRRRSNPPGGIPAGRRL